MNERIRELALQAGLLPREIGPVVETRHMKKKQQDLEKFAELIVRECVQVGGPEDSYTDEWFKAKADSVNKIREHFGVEE
jgi:hypothetical protein